ncbi:MAG: DUF3179 domain-containing protein [Pseudomonadota bacterium]
MAKLVSLAVAGFVWFGSAQALADTILSDLDALFAQNSEKRAEIIEKLRLRGTDDILPALVHYKRYLRMPPAFDQLMVDLADLSGAEDVPETWHEWMLWLEANPHIEPFDGFDRFKSKIFRRIDPDFDHFIYPGVARDIRLEEIVWGGVSKDGIPALTNPDLIGADNAHFMTDDELVFGVEINGDVRAYPLRIMDWHEMFNDVIGGVPVSLAYCTLCGSGILFQTSVEGRAAPLVFGSSGLLYRSNKLMYDNATHSLWNQFTGKPVVGPLVGSDIALKTRPVVITSWGKWTAKHPETKVLSLRTGHRRDYTPGAPYGRYFDSPDLMFPAMVRRDELQAKDYVFALRSSGAEKAWPITAFEGGRVINDRAGALTLVLIGDAANRTVRAFRAGGQTFQRGDTSSSLVDQSGFEWTVTESALISEDGRQLTRLPGHIAYWFAWAGYFGEAGEFGSAKPH